MVVKVLIQYKTFFKYSINIFGYAFVFIIISFALSGSALYAQDAKNNAAPINTVPIVDVAAKGVVNIDELVKTQQATLKAQQDRLTELTKNFQDKKNDDSALLNIRQKLQSLNADILSQAMIFRQPLLDVNLKLDQLGAAPTDKAEDAEKTSARKQLSDQKNAINQQLARFENVYISSNQLLNNITNQRREIFTNALTQHIVFNKAFFNQVASSSQESSFSLLQIVNNYVAWTSQNHLSYFIFALIGGLVCALIIIIIGRYLAYKSKLVVYDDESTISYLRLVLVALLTSLTASIAVLFFFNVFAAIFTYNNKFPADVEVLFRALKHFVFIFVLIASIAKALFLPSAKDLALVDITPIAARKLNFLVCAIAGIFGLNWLLNDAYQVVSAPLSLAIAKDFLCVVLVGLLLILIAFVSPGKKESPCSFVPFPWGVRALIILGGALPLVMAMLGYVGMGRFIIQQIVVDFTFLILIYLGLSVSSTLTREGAFAQTRLGQTISKYFKAGPVALDQLGLLVGIVAGILVLLLCIPPILMQFGFSINEIFGLLNQLLTGFQIGNVSVSLLSVSIGVGFFIGALVLFRWFFGYFDRVILARSHVDVGIRNSVKTISGYIAIAFAAMVAMSAAGFNLSNLALIAGGLSLGIGFGLQNIVQNFVSGLILLAERPFKVGDYVDTGTIQGTVRRISVRATEIETGQKNTIIVPNSSLINGNVGNWTLRNKMGRVDLPFTIPLAFKPEDVRDKLLAIATSVDTIMRKPEPTVEFVSFDDLGMVFTLYVHVPDITSTTATKNAIRLAVFNTFYKDWSKAVQAWEQRNFPQYNDVDDYDSLADDADGGKKT